MKKIFSRISENILPAITLFLLAFIPLYPKKPLLDIQHTWVYIRIEDFIVAFVLLIWVMLLLTKKVSLKSPLTLPIILFWIIGGIATLHGVLLIFPNISGVFSNVALLSYLRKIEYMSLFFIAFTSVKDKKFLYYVIATLVIVLIMVAGYGFGQKYYGFPAYLTMNEEFAKGVPIQISQLARVPSTFAGHYDLAAYLVLIIPLLISIAFGFKNWIVKIFLYGASILGFVLMFMTVSRVSFFVLLLAMVLVLILHKKRFLIVCLLILNVLFLSLFPSLLQRFGSTVTEIDVLVDAQTGQALGNAQEISAASFENKKIVAKTYSSTQAIYGIKAEDIEATIIASSSAVIPFATLPSEVFILVEPNAPTGEDLPQGTGYINLHLSPIKKKIGQFYYNLPAKDGLESDNKVVAFQGNFLIKRAQAYDLSYTTRFQGEWPRTIDAFKQNIFLGSGYGSVSLAVDNNYLRILGESGILGFGFFILVFVCAGIYIKKILPHVDSPVVKSFVLGFIAGTFGLALNAVLIDVFEASKIAFTYWLLMGVTLGTLHVYSKSEIDMASEFKKLFTSNYLAIILLITIVVGIFSSAYSYYFVGDDFTWLRWAAECSKNCEPIGRITEYFTNSNGFFYRPGTKIYFYLMYSTFWLNPTVYHIVSIVLHLIFSILVFLVSKRILKNFYLGLMTAVLFLILSGNAEGVVWISATGHLFNAVFALLSLLLFMYWKEYKKTIFFIGSIISISLSLLFHELGVAVPLLVILYDLVFYERFNVQKIVRKSYYWILLFPTVPYLLLRYFASSHWLNGDYSYNFLKLPYNAVGNLLGYTLLSLFGPIIEPVYQGLRNVSKENLLITVVIGLIMTFVVVLAYKKVIRKLAAEEQNIIIFGVLFIIIALLPFLGLGNMASRYNYLSSVGFAIVFVYIIKQAYTYLIKISDKNTAVASIVTISIIFSALHLFQLQKIHSEWHAAGERSERFLISLNEIYSDGWTTSEVYTYFVDVPIRYGDAWLFPVGLKDAVWFVFRNDKLRVYQSATLEEAFNAIQNPETQKVFIFTGEGGVVEKEKPLHNSITPTNVK